jgi:hypothetical protein
MRAVMPPGDGLILSTQTAAANRHTARARSEVLQLPRRSLARTDSPALEREGRALAGLFARLSPASDLSV